MSGRTLSPGPFGSRVGENSLMSLAKYPRLAPTARTRKLGRANFREDFWDRSHF